MIPNMDIIVAAIEVAAAVAHITGDIHHVNGLKANGSNKGALDLLPYESLLLCEP